MTDNIEQSWIIPNNNVIRNFGDTVIIWRNPRTIQESRINAAPEHKKFVRAKRNYRHLPNNWDDISFGRRKVLTHRQKIIARNDYHKTIRRDMQLLDI
jgi:hypothetical protein